MTDETPEVDEPIELVEPDPSWPSLFSAEARRIREAVGDTIVSIHHVGSTAVPLAGKPIVDLLVGVRSLEEAKRDVAPRLVEMGYEDFGEIFIEGRLYLRRRGPPHFNLAVAVEDGPFFRRQLAVREYLRAHPRQAAAYEDEKRRAYEAGARLFSTYSQEKADFLDDLMARALKWTEEGAGTRRA